MMKASIILTCLLALFTSCICSSAIAGPVIKESDTIEIKKKFGGYHFYDEGRLMTMTQLKLALKQDREAFHEFKSGRTANGIATVLIASGGALIGWPIGSFIAGGEPQWALLGAGVGLVGISLPFAFKANKKYKKGVEVYNRNAVNTTSARAVGFRLGFTGQGVGLVMGF